MRHTLVVCAIACAMALVTQSFSQVRNAASNGGPAMPLTTFTVSPTKEKKPLTVTIVGTNPFSATPSGSVIDAVVVPMIFNIGGTVFDPTTPNSCDSNVSALNRFNWSPMVQPVVSLTFNGVNVGTAQYVDDFMRAEFWNATGGNPAYTNSINWSTAAPVTITTGSSGITSGTGCSMVGVVSQALLDSQISSLLQSLTQSGVISPAKFVLFLTTDVVGSSGNSPAPPGTSRCCNYGYHRFTGNPPQFYAFADYAQGGPNELAIVSHEVAEFMNDPLVNNPTPHWGGIGEISGCSGLLEVGDPLVGMKAWMPITMNGFTYHPQTVALLPWFEFQGNSSAIHNAYSYPNESALTALSAPQPLNCGQ